MKNDNKDDLQFVARLVLGVLGGALIYWVAGHAIRGLVLMIVDKITK
jgi:hypothetical protein